MSGDKTLSEIRSKLDRRLAERKAAQERLEKLKSENARAIRRAEEAKRILEHA